MRVLGAVRVARRHGSRGAAGAYSATAAPAARTRETLDGVPARRVCRHRCPGFQFGPGDKTPQGGHQDRTLRQPVNLGLAGRSGEESEEGCRHRVVHPAIRAGAIRSAWGQCRVCRSSEGTRSTRGGRHGWRQGVSWHRSFRSGHRDARQPTRRSKASGRHSRRNDEEYSEGASRRSLSHTRGCARPETPDNGSSSTTPNSPCRLCSCSTAGRNVP